MNQLELVKILKDKYSQPNFRYRIGIRGEWGIGKSYAWELFKDEMQNNHKDLKIIYCSLFGIENVDELKKELRRKKIEHGEILGKVGQSKGMTAIKMVGEVLSNKFVGGTIDILELVTLEFGEGYLICFDDLERTSSNSNITVFMGVIEQVAQSTNVLLIYNEEEINDKEGFQRYKEKVVELEYTIDSLSHEVIEGIIKKDGTLTNDELQTLSTFFTKYGKNNLRTLTKLTRFICDLKSKIPINNEIITLSAAVFLEEVIKVKPESQLTDEEKNEIELNPLFIYRDYGIKYKAFSLMSAIKTYIVSNTINKSAFEEYMNPQERRKVVELLDSFSEGILGDEQSVFKLIEQSLGLLKYADVNELLEEDIIRLVGEMKYFNQLFKLNILPINLEELAFDRVKEILDSNYKIRSIQKDSRVSAFYRLSISNTAHTLARELLSKAVKYEEEILIKLMEEELNVSFSACNYDSCESILRRNSMLILNNLFILDGLVQKCSYEYYMFIRNIVGMDFEDGVRKVIRKKLFDLKRESNDPVIKHRVRIVLAAFLEINYGKVIAMP